MARFEAVISEMDCPERQDIVAEIRNHIAEARAAGKPLDAIVEALGPADVLARAYAVELLLNRPEKRPVRAVGRFLKIAGVIAATSIATLIVVAALGSVGIGLSVSGLAMFVIGVLEASDVHLPGVEMKGISPMWAIALGPVLLVVGLGALIALRMYVRFVARTVRRVLPRIRPAAIAG
jgi:uncharacterized membrane protein